MLNITQKFLKPMYIEDFEPVSGTLFYLDCCEALDVIEEKDDTTKFVKSILRGGITNFVLPVFTEIGFYWNLTLGLIKLPILLFAKNYQTESFANQIQSHFRCALLDAISTRIWHFTPLRKWIPSSGSWYSLHYPWVLSYALFREKVLHISEELKKAIYPKNPVIPVDPRLLV